MNFDKESKSEKGGGGGGSTEKKINRYLLIFCAHALYKFQVPGSSGSLVLTQTKGLADRYGA